jgi:DNA-binding NarL/FixJ family response regulator
MAVNGAESKIRIVIAEENTLFRECLRFILNENENIEIVGEAINGLQAVEVISDLKPDVALVDIIMPKLNGIGVLQAIKRKSPGTKVLILMATMDEEMALEAMKAGARGYLHEIGSVLNLFKGIKAVHEGEVWVERKVMTKFFDTQGAASLGKDERPKKTREALTPREQEVLCLLTKGSTNKEIAQTLFISEKTVKSHLNSIFRKLNVSRRLQAILRAMKLGVC